MWKKRPKGAALKLFRQWERASTKEIFNGHSGIFSTKGPNISRSYFGNSLKGKIATIGGWGHCAAGPIGRLSG